MGGARGGELGRAHGQAPVAGERSYRRLPPGPCVEASLIRWDAGRHRGLGPSHIHRIRHAPGREAVSLDLYSPPLERLGCYRVGDAGVLQLISVAAEVELRPLTVA